GLVSAEGDDLVDQLRVREEHPAAAVPLHAEGVEDGARALPGAGARDEGLPQPRVERAPPLAANVPPVAELRGEPRLRARDQGLLRVHDDDLLPEEEPLRESACETPDDLPARVHDRHRLTPGSVRPRLSGASARTR